MSNYCEDAFGYGFAGLMDVCAIGLRRWFCIFIPCYSLGMEVVHHGVARKYFLDYHAVFVRESNTGLPFSGLAHLLQVHENRLWKWSL